LSRHAKLRDRQMAPILYASPSILVTSRWLSRHGQRYDVATLTDAMLVRGPLHAGVFVALFVSLAGALLFLPAAVLAGSVPVFAVGLIAMFLPCPVAWLYVHRKPPQRELWAQYRGVAVCLFASRDEREFGQVSRAVQRAMEAARA
jgi:hypothetical protein